MNQWKAWLERGQKDLQIAKEMLEKPDYEHAAYMTQQALEKHVKSVWIIGGGEPKELSHDVVGYLVEEIQRDIKEDRFDSSVVPKEVAEKIAADLSKIRDDMRKQYSTKVAIWKHSIGIETTEVSGRLQGHVDAAEEFFKKYKGYESQIFIIRKAAKSRAASYAEKPSYLKQGQIRTVALQAIMAVMKLIVETLPHETYGRYPIHIESEKKNSIAVYAEQSSNLKKLVCKTDEECTYLSCVAENLAKARKK